jgi:hypothetical protein
VTPQEIAALALALQGAIEAGFILGAKFFGVIWGARVLLSMLSERGGR